MEEEKYSCSWFSFQYFYTFLLWYESDFSELPTLLEEYSKIFFLPENSKALLSLPTLQKLLADQETSNRLQSVNSHLKKESPCSHQRKSEIIRNFLTSFEIMNVITSSWLPMVEYSRSNSSGFRKKCASTSMGPSSQNIVVLPRFKVRSFTGKKKLEWLSWRWVRGWMKEISSRFGISTLQKMRQQRHFLPNSQTSPGKHL